MGKTLGYGEITVANMTEPFTVMLTNEAQQFATDSNRKVTSAQSYYTDIIVIRGSQERTDYTIGNITSGSGITVSKNSKRVTFSVSAGTTIGADAGVIEIPITLDGQTVKKQFSWSCGKQGPQGVKGDPGTSVKITSKSVTYQTSTSGTTAPTGTWSTTVPTVNNGQYLWTKTTVQYSDGNKTEAYSVSYKGTNGTNGTSVTVSKTEVTYQVSTSGTTAPTGTWSATMPSCDQGLYLWTKTYVKYSDGKDTTSYSVSYKGVDGEKFAFNMLRETNQGSKHWGNHASGGKYSVESTTTEDGINAVKIITTEAIPSNGWHYVTFADYKMLKSLTPSTTYTLSFDIWSNQGNHYEWITIQQGSATNAMTSSSLVQIKGNENWQHTTTTLTTVASMPEIASQCIYMTGTSAIGYAIIKNLKLTEGAVDTPWAPHPEDLEGRGVSQTVQYYLATSQASGVTSSTSGWSTDITTQKLTADKKYLWNCYQTKYSDGTSEPISTPKVIGVYGDKGQKGENAKNLSITPSSQYFKSTDGGKTFAPNTITIKPTIQGEINFGKWQYSIDGGVSFADAVSGQKGLTISNNVLAVSKDSSLYSDAVTMVTFRAVASDSSFYDTCSIAKIYDVSDIGDGRNLLTGVSSYTKDTPFEKTDSRADGWIVYQNIITSIELEAGKKYVLQAKTDGNWTANHDTNGQDPSKKLVALWLCSDTTNDFFDMRQGYAVFTPAVTAKYKLRVNQYSNGTDAYTIHLWDIKLEKGSSPTGWTPAPEDLQTAILSTKSEISDVSLKVDNNKQAIEQRVEKTTYEQDLTLVKGDIGKANEGLNKWRYEIYPKSLFTNKPEDQRKISLDVFARNKNIIPTQSILLDDTKLGYSNYDDNYIGYAVTFVKMSEATKLETTFVHDDAGSFYLNGKLICTNGNNNFYSSATPDTVSCTLVKGWNCLEVVINEGTGSEGFKFGTVLSQLSTCQLMNCYYAMVTGRESQITNTLVQNTIDIEGVGTKVSKVTSIIGDNGENFTSFKNEYSDFKQTMNEFKTTVGQTYVTKDDFNGLEIGGRNLLRDADTMSTWIKGTKLAITYGQSDPDGGSKAIKIVNSEGTYGAAWIEPKERHTYFKSGQYTYSFYAKSDAASGSQIQTCITGNYTKVFDLTTTWKRYTYTITIANDLNTVDMYWFNFAGKSAIYFYHPKLETGNKATDFTIAPEDTNQQITAAETVATQTADKFNWLVKSGTSSTDFELTDRTATLVASAININGLVKFSGLNTDLQNTINNKTNVSYLNFSSGGNTKGFFKIATLQVKQNYANQNIIFGVNHREHGYTECRIRFSNAGNTDPGMGSFKQTGTPARAWRIIKTATSTWDLYLAKADVWDGGRVTKFDNPYGENMLITWSGASADLPEGALVAEQMIADQTTIDGGIITTGYLSADRIAAGSITADKIATDAIKSRNYISSGGTQGSFLNLSDGSFTSPNLSWDSNGNLIAKNANLSGQITATIGSIGGWNIGDTSLFTGITKSNVRIYDAVNADNAQNMYQKEQHSLILANTYINSFNSSLNSSDNYWHAQGVTINDGEFQVGETLYNPNLVNSDKDEVYYDRGLTRVFGGYITMSRDCSINSDSRSLYADIILNGEELYICTNRNILFSPLRTSIFTTEDPSKYNAIETIGDVVVNGKIKASNELQTTASQMRIISGSIGCMLRNDSADFYILRTNAGDPYGDWTNDRPFRINWATNDITCGHNLTANDLIANGWIYNASGGHYTWQGRNDAYISCGSYNNTNNIYYYAGYHAFYVNGDSGSGMMYIETSGVSSRVGFTKTSDERIKKNFESFDDNIIDAYMNIEPVKYQLKQSSNDKYHFGFKAQHIDKVFSDYGDIYNESFDICTSRPIDPDKAKELYGVDGMVEEYGLRYDELIAPTTYMVQHTYKELESTKDELTKVKQEKADLETRLQAIEAKLGL